MSIRLTIFIISLAIAVLAGWFFLQFDISAGSSYPIYAISAIIFLGILVSNQQYEEDVISKIERIAGSFLFSYIIFFQLCYAPLYKLFFGTLVTAQSFLADLLLLFLFGIFFFLFGTSFLVLNTYSRIGFLGHWRFFNNEKMFFVLRILFIPAVVICVLPILKRYL